MVFKRRPFFRSLKPQHNHFDRSVTLRPPYPAGGYVRYDQACPGPLLQRTNQERW